MDCTTDNRQAASPASTSEHAKLAATLRSMVRDLDIRAQGASDAVRQLQGVVVAGQFLAQVNPLVREFGGQEAHIGCVPERKLPLFKEWMEKIRVDLLEAMFAARGVQPSTWIWPRVTVAARAQAVAGPLPAPMKQLEAHADSLGALHEQPGGLLNNTGKTLEARTGLGPQADP